MQLLRQRSGYILLLTALATSAIVGSIAVTLLVLSTIGARTTASVVDATQALAAAEACAERAVLELWRDERYPGGSFDIGGVTCKIHPLGPSDNTGTQDREICTEATVGDTTRLVEVVVDSLIPDVSIENWQEVGCFHLCGSEIPHKCTL